LRWEIDAEKTFNFHSMGITESSSLDPPWSLGSTVQPLCFWNHRLRFLCPCHCSLFAFSDHPSWIAFNFWKDTGGQRETQLLGKLVTIWCHRNGSAKGHGE
jgi:hypothetical protein